MANELKTYTKITFDDETWCICEPEQVGDLTIDQADFTLSEVEMTEEEFDALPEYNG